MIKIYLSGLSAVAMLLIGTTGQVSAAEVAAQCAIDSKIRLCPSLCLAACEDPSFYLGHGQACRDIAGRAPDSAKEPASCRGNERPESPASASATPPDDNFPSCTANVEALRRSYSSLNARSDQAGKRYKELIDRGYSKIVEICSIPHKVLVKDLETAESTDADVQKIQDDYNAINSCFNKVMDWFRAYDLSLVELGPEVRQRVLKSVADEVADLSKTNEKFDADLQSVRRARDTLKQLRDMHYRACGDRPNQQ